MKIRTIYPAIFMCVSILVTTCISLTAAQTAPAPEKQKIEALIGRVGQLKDVKSFGMAGPMNPRPPLVFCAVNGQPTTLK
jgi:hypothetical protein